MLTCVAYVRITLLYLCKGNEVTVRMLSLNESLNIRRTHATAINSRRIYVHTLYIWLLSSFCHRRYDEPRKSFNGILGTVFSPSFCVHESGRARDCLPLVCVRMCHLVYAKRTMCSHFKYFQMNTIYIQIFCHLFFIRFGILLFDTLHRPSSG